MDKILIDVEETAKILNVSKQRVWSMARAGMFPDGVIVRFARQIRFSKQRLMEWIDAGGDTRNPDINDKEAVTLARPNICR